MNLYRLESHLFLFSILLAIGSSANILGVFPIEAKSHFFFDFAIMKTLAESGHNVTMICPFPEVGPSSNIHIIDYRTNLTSELKSRFANPDFQKTSVLQHWQNAKIRLTRDCKDFTNSPKIQDLLSSTSIKFDIMFVHMLPMYECYLPIAKKYEIPVIGTVTFRQFMSIDEAVGNPHHLTLPFTSSTNPRVMTFFQRLRNTGYHLLLKAFYDFEISAALGEFFEQYYPAIVKNDIDKISLLFSNNHPSILSKPLASNVVEIGGIHIGRSKPLPQKLEKFIASSKHGVILFSLGSIADHDMINEQIQQILRETFAEIPQHVIWKFGKQVANVTDNVYITEWVPQFDILSKCDAVQETIHKSANLIFELMIPSCRGAHPNVKVFISHCGISGTYEAIYTSTPMILLPLFGDQPANAALLNEMEVGVRVDITTLSKEILLTAIDSLMKEDKYSRNMDHLSYIFKDQPVSHKKSVIYWTNYILRRRGAHHLNVGIKNIPLYQYLLLDILLFFLIMMIMALYVMKLCYRKYNSIWG